MKKWIQVFVDEKDSEESVPYRIDPDQIYGFKKYGCSQTIIFTKIGAYTICEDYEHFSSRLFFFTNEIDEQQTSVSKSDGKKKFIIKKKVTTHEEESYFDKYQPETNY